MQVAKATNVTRELTVWFLEQEASTGKIKIDEEEPETIKVVLRYIYGGGMYMDDRATDPSLTPRQAAAVDMFQETKNKPVFTTCVAVYRAAHFFLLHPLVFIVQDRLRKYCDSRLKRLCTRNTGAGPDAKTWAAGLADAIRMAYKADLAPIKMILWEFVWAGRWQLLGGGACDISYIVDDTPEFLKDVLHNCATKQWLDDPVWAPKRPDKSLARWAWQCARCKTTLASANTNEAEGQVFDPFTLGEENTVRREWCRKCSAMKTIPWRGASY